MGMEYAIVAAAVIAAGAGIYAANQKPSLPTPTPPAGSVDYTSGYRQRWDAATNSYVTEQIPDSEITQEQLDERNKERANKKKNEELRAKFVEQLNKTPEDWIKAKDDYMAAFSSEMHRDVDKRWEDTRTTEEERLNARGLFGSKAYADTIAEMNKDKLASDTDIANKATLAGEQILEDRRNFALNAINSIDTGSRADAILEAQKANALHNTSQLGTSVGLAQYAAQNQNELAKWEGKQKLAANLSNTATGLAFLYGYSKKSPLAGSGEGSSQTAYNTKIPSSFLNYRY